MKGVYIKINSEMCKVLLKHLDLGNVNTPEKERKALFDARRAMILCAGRGDVKEIMDEARGRV